MCVKSVCICPLESLRKTARKFDKSAEGFYTGLTRSSQILTVAEVTATRRLKEQGEGSKSPYWDLDYDRELPTGEETAHLWLVQGRTVGHCRQSHPKQAEGERNILDAPFVPALHVLPGLPSLST